MSKNPTYEEVKAELISELKDISYSKEVRDKKVRDIALTHSRYVDRMVEVALSKLDKRARHYMEVGENAEKFFKSMGMG